MPWADSLWAVTYNSHTRTTGTGLGLFRIDDRLRSELVHTHDGTHANRFLHKQSAQVFIGPYAIDAKGTFRFIEALKDHRLTATMAHLTDPANRVYMQTMEGLLFEIDVETLKIKLVSDVVKEVGLKARPHFKGGYTGQGRVVVSNNGFYEYGDTEAGLFEYDGKRWNRLSDKPHMDCAGRENLGNVIFCTGWDESSVLFWALVKGTWQRYRLPKASHAFQHAWQTEWMRIREVETEHFLMDIHGMFFELQPMALEDKIWGVKPISQHLRMVPDFCAFRGLLALGGNQTSPNGGNYSLAGQPQSGIWFGKTDDLWQWGKPAGWGGPWRKSAIKKDVPSEPFLMTGFDRKMLHLRADPSASFLVQVDFLGSGYWQDYATLKAASYTHHVFPSGFSAHWVRLIPSADCTASAEFFYS
ncbi:MAG: hypothetical protein H7039_24590, partial [Bryobacteraceae bacterium]|nr:hypothetical protein [Bryobacteraceae bacterium]